MKDFTFTIRAKDENGQIVTANETNKTKGYKQSWFKTAEAAKKMLKRNINWFGYKGYTEVEWVLYSKTGVIEASK